MPDVRIIKGNDLETWKAGREKVQQQQLSKEDEHLYGHLVSTVLILVKRFPGRKNDIIAKINQAKAA